MIVTNDSINHEFNNFNKNYYYYYYYYYYYLSSQSFFVIYPPPMQDLHPPDLNPTCKESNRLWTRTLDRYTRAGLRECVVSTMSGRLPETTQDRTQSKDTYPVPGWNLKFLTPPGLEGRDSTNHATKTKNDNLYLHLK